jgi:hypothetical protein
LAGADLAASAVLVDRFQRALERVDRAAIVECIRERLAQKVPMGPQW